VRLGIGGENAKNVFLEKYESFGIDDFLATTVKSTFEGEHHSSIICVYSTVICRRRISFHCLLLDILAWQSALQIIREDSVKTTQLTKNKLERGPEKYWKRGFYWQN
jgi:hypothetical protein